MAVAGHNLVPALPGSVLCAVGKDGVCSARRMPCLLMHDACSSTVQRGQRPADASRFAVVSRGTLLCSSSEGQCMSMFIVVQTAATGMWHGVLWPPVISLIVSKTRHEPDVPQCVASVWCGSASFVPEGLGGLGRLGSVLRRCFNHRKPSAGAARGCARGGW